MINSWTTREQALVEAKRLLLIKASLIDDLLAFSFGFPINQPLTELENELHATEIGLKEIEEKFNITAIDITI